MRAPVVVEVEAVELVIFTLPDDKHCNTFWPFAWILKLWFVVVPIWTLCVIQCIAVRTVPFDAIKHSPFVVLVTFILLVAVKEWIFVISLLESNIKALLAAAVPAVTLVIGSNVVDIPEMLLISVAVAVIAIPFNVKLPVDKLVNVPTEVIFGWDAVCNVPVKFVADKELIFDTLLDKSLVITILLYDWESCKRNTLAVESYNNLAWICGSPVNSELVNFLKTTMILK